MSAETHQGKTIHLATDHAGFELKENIKQWLTGDGHTVVDHGAESYDSEDDFPDFIIPAAKAVSESDAAVAIIFGGSGQGEAMAANRQKGVRATVYYGGDTKIVTLSRDHNNANVLSLGARFLDATLAKKVIRVWLMTPFHPAEKRVRRNKKLDQ